MSAIPTVKIKHNGPLGFCIVNADELTPDMTVLNDLSEIYEIGDQMMQEDTPETELPPVKVAAKKTRVKAG
jgi:hypothetical protein